MKKNSRIPDDIKTISQKEVDDLIGRIKSSSLAEGDKDLIKGFIEIVVTLRILLAKRTFGLRSLLRKIFGFKTEKYRPRANATPANSATGAPAGSSTPKNDADSSTTGNKKHDGKRKGGNGRHGQEDYPGAKRVILKHDHLCPGDDCPVCHKGKLKEADPGVAYRWSGNLPLTLIIYELTRLICHNCKSTFVARLPGEVVDVSHLDPSLPVDVARPDERSADATVAASLATLRFELGVPHYRLADAQAAQGIPLPPSTQSKMMEPLREPAEAVVNCLEKLVGEKSDLVINDDTHMRVLDIERGKEEPPDEKLSTSSDKKTELLRPKAIDVNQEKTHGPKAITSAVVAKIGDHTVCLHYTGFTNAGGNLAKILAHRSGEVSPPLQMCDALDANLAKDFHTLLGNCLDHARRQFYGLESYYPKEVNELFVRLGKVYGFDAKAKELELEADERLTWHQMYSAPEMGELWLWAHDLKNSTNIMPNSELMRPVNYLINHWTELTTFLRVAGAPLSNAEVERLIKRCIRHRKNSLQYKTLRGARFGDMMMSLIQTCRYAHDSAHAYLTALCRYSDCVIANPEKWLPWNWREAVPDTG